MLKNNFSAPRSLRRYALAGVMTAGLAGFGLTSHAQSTNESVEIESDDEELIVLSPFVVETSEENNTYRAESTLAGSRVRTDLKDIASPISVITSQFLKDTASTSNQELLNYTTNTEVGGLFGNYGGFGNGQGLSDRDALLTPNNNTRVRGLESADNTRNFFLSDIPWDSYNIDRVEIQRGPNSILFGVGSPSGIINSNTVQAKFNGNSGKVDTQVSSFASIRAVADYNAEIIDDVLAIRVTGLINNQKYRQKPAFNDDERFFATLSYEPQLFSSDWAGPLSVRVNYETASIKANRPRILPPDDGITLWFEDYAGDGVNDEIGFGQRVYDMFLWSQTGGGDPGRGSIASALGDVLNPLPYQPGVAVVDGGALNNGGIGFFFENGSPAPYFVSRQSPRAHPGALAADGSIDNTVSIPYGSPMRVGGFYTYAVAVDKIDEVEGVTSRFPLATRGYYKDKSLTDPTIFNFYDQLIDGDNKREFQEWDAISFSLAQTFWDNRLGVEFVYDKQEYSQWRGGSAWSRPYISIDINKNLQNQLTQYTHDANDLLDTSSYQAIGFTPTASQPYVNPHAGSAFTAGSFSNNTRTDRQRESKRVTLFTELRASDLFGEDSFFAHVLGRHVLTGLWTEENRDEQTTTWAPSAVDYDWAVSQSVNGENTALGEAPRGITPVIYLSGPLFGRASASGLNLGPIDVNYNPVGTYNTDYFQTTWKYSTNPSDPNYLDPGADWTDLLGGASTQSENPFNYVGRTTMPVRILNADNGDIAELTTAYGMREQTIDSKGLVWQGHLFDGLIVPTIGWREDTLATYTYSATEDNGGKNGATGIASTEDGELSQLLEKTGNTSSWGIVAHMPAKWMDAIPVLSGLSAYYNYGENNKVEARYNYDGEPLDNPSAESVDYGVVVSAFNDKLTLKVGHFETKVKNGNLPGGTSILGNNQYYLYNLEAWGTANALMYVFGREGLDPNQNWHWNWALVDNGWDDAYNDVTSDLFKNDASTLYQEQVLDAWFAGMDAQFFENYSINADVAALQAAYASYKSTGNVQPLIDAAAASGFAVGTYTTGFSSQSNGEINGISPNGTIDNTSEGYEIEINWQPSSNWNLQVNASKTTAYRENLGEPMLSYIESQWSKLQGPAGDIRLWWGGDNTLRRYYEDNIISAVEFQKESIGFQVPELRPWHFSAITNYSFNEGMFKNVNVGGAWRWQDKQILGYGLKSDNSGLSVDNPIYGDSEQHVDLWVGYNRKLTEKVDWRIQLNLRNVGEKKGLTPISANPDGSIASLRITEGMTWALSNTFSF